MIKRSRKLLPTRHTGRRVAHQHTSYAALGFVLLLSGLVVLTLTLGALAEEAIKVQTTVNGPVPATPPTITQPGNNQRFSNAEINVEGTCSRGYLLKLFKNNIQAGSTTCGFDQRWVMPISLVFGRNELVARQFNYSEQNGPPSNTVVVFLDRAGADPSLPGPGANAPDPVYDQLILTPQKLFQGVLINEQGEWVFNIRGGQGPYNVSLDWGDADQDVFSTDQLTLTQKHTYLKAGEYKVVVRVKDLSGQQAVVQVVALVRDLSSAKTISTQPPGGALSIAWPVLAILLLLVLSFWLGERHEISWLRGHPKREREMLHPPQ